MAYYSIVSDHNQEKKIGVFDLERTCSLKDTDVAQKMQLHKLLLILISLTLLFERFKVGLGEIKS